MTTFQKFFFAINATGRPEVQAAGVSAVLAKQVRLAGREIDL